MGQCASFYNFSACARFMEAERRLEIQERLDIKEAIFVPRDPEDFT